MCQTLVMLNSSGLGITMEGMFSWRRGRGCGHRTDWQVQEAEELAGAGGRGIAKNMIVLDER